MQTANATAATSTAEDEVRAVLDEWVAGCRAGDFDRIGACYDPDVLAFDAIMTMQFKGLEAYAAHWKMCLSHMAGGMVYEVHDLDITAEGSLAYCHHLARCGATDKEGNEHTGWLRVTACLARRPGGWRIVHEHFSAPFDPDTMKVLDVRP